MPSCQHGRPTEAVSRGCRKKAAGSSCSRWRVCRARSAYPPIAWVIAAACLVAAPDAQQPDQPAFRSGVHVVEVDVRVFDQAGRFITDLTRDDFELIENGVPQQLQTLYIVEGEQSAGLSTA